MNRLSTAVTITALALIASPAFAEDPNLARNLAANCANCHGTNGKAVPDAGMAAIAGEPPEKLVKRFQEYRSGVRPSTVMQQIAKGYTDAQIELIAGYLAAQK